MYAKYVKMLHFLCTYGIFVLSGGIKMNDIFKNSYKIRKNELFSLSVCNVGHEKCNSRHRWGPGTRDHYLIHHVMSGKGYYYCNGKVYSLKTGDSFLIYPNREVIYYADEQDPWEYAWIGFTGNDAPSILQATQFSPSSPVTYNNIHHGEINQRMNQIFNARGSDYVNAVEMAGYLYMLLAIFMREAKKKNRMSRTESYVIKGIEFISSNYGLPITVNDIAAYVGLSRSHLFRAFQSVLEKSPKEYLTEYRIKQACYMLANSTMSIGAIAESVGFDNSLYFSKAFHKQIGMSPSEYAKEKHKKSDAV